MRRDLIRRCTITVHLVAVLQLTLMGVAKGEKLYDFLIRPTYSTCLGASAGASCSSAGRTTLIIKYKAITTKTRTLRIELSRSYRQSDTEDDSDDVDVVGGRSYQAATDLLVAKLAALPDGFERTNLQVGYSYQHSLGGSVAYHTIYGSYDFFFGRQIKRGSSSPAHQFDALLRVSQNAYQSKVQPPQSFVQLTPGVTYPLDPNGSNRVFVGYTAQRQFAGGGRLSPFSSSALSRFTHNFTPFVKGWAYVEWRLLDAPAAQQTTTFGLGAEVTL